jgi:hypothetical protein
MPAKRGPSLWGAVTAMAQMCNQSELEAVGDRENGNITSRTPARSRNSYNIQFVMHPKIRAWDDGNTHEGRKRS